MIESLIERLFAVFLVLALMTGCAGYQIGTRSLYRNNIRTIHVPIIKCDSFRPELGVYLTEAVQKEIELRTPYKLTNIETADSIMICRLTTDSKRVVSQTITSEPRLLQTVITVELSWNDQRGQSLFENRFLPPGETTYYFAENVSLVPEAGQSISAANQRAIERLANHIVDQMELRW